MIEIRPPTPDELDPMLAVMCEAFGLPFGPARDLFYHDPFFDIGNKRVLLADGRIVSCLTIVDTVMRIGPAPVRLAGIANVCTLASERRKGYAAKLLVDTIAALRRRGFGLSALLPYSYRFYHRFGWELGSMQHKLAVAPAALPAYGDVRHVRTALPSDLADIERLYEEASSGRTGSCLRDSRRWGYLFEHAKCKVVYKRRSLEGYALYEIDPLPDSIRVLRVLELVSVTAEAARGIAGFLAGHAGDIARIEYTAGLENLAASGLLESLPDPSALPASEVRVTPGAMFRVLDFERILRELSGNLAGLNGRIALALDDPYAEPHVQSVVELEGDGSQVRVSAVDRDGSRARIRGDVRPWSQVVCGYRSLADALALNRLTAFSQSAAALASPLFPRRRPFIPVPDHF